MTASVRHLEHLRTALRTAFAFVLTRMVYVTLACAFIFWTMSSQAAPNTDLDGTRVDLMQRGSLYTAKDSVFPRADMLESWTAQQTPTTLDPFGGAYWLDATVAAHSDATRWVMYVSNTLIEHVEVAVYDSSQSLNTVPARCSTGYYAAYEYPFVYACDVHLEQGHSYRVLMHMKSRYFAGPPIVEIRPKADFLRSYAARILTTMFGLGGLLMLALYNLFLFASVRDRSYLHYALYLLVYMAGWASVLHVFAHVFGVHNLAAIYLCFFAGPVLNMVFYLNFLKLDELAPRLAKASRIHIAISIAISPVAFLAQSAMHTVASLVLFVWLVLGLSSGLVCWRQGYRPARYFTFGFAALLVPGLLILPANLHLMPLRIADPELFGLYGGFVDALLLALALADRIRHTEVLKDQTLVQLRDALNQARTDALTGLANRFAFDEKLSSLFHAQPAGAAESVLFVVDLDGLKAINDTRGHAEGDLLLKTFARELNAISGATSFRLGGDEFTILATAEAEPEVRTHLEQIELTLRTSGFANSGVSYGVCRTSEVSTSKEVLSAADERMYLHKEARRAARANYRTSQRPPAL
jgi:diguanylate cyclase (GGDEF)-like protein